MLSRRRLLVTAAAASAVAMFRPGAKGAAAQESALYCSWVNTGVTRCHLGELQQKWEFLCCEGIGCEAWDIDWRPIGVC